MSSVKFRDSDGNVYYLNMADGVGSEADPFVGPGDATAVNLPVYVTQSGDGTAQEVYVTGCLMVKDCTGVSGIVQGLLVTGDASSPLYIHDGGNSLTVDNTSGSPLYIDNTSGSPLYITDTTTGSPAYSSGNPLYVDQPLGRSMRIRHITQNPVAGHNGDYTNGDYEREYTRSSAQTIFNTSGTTKFNTPGTAGASSPNDYPHTKYIVKAPTSNNVAIWIGAQSSAAAVSGDRAFPMYPGESHEFHSANLDYHYGITDVGGHANNSLYIFKD